MLKVKNGGRKRIPTFLWDTPTIQNVSVGILTNFEEDTVGGRNPKQPPGMYKTL